MDATDPLAALFEAASFAARAHAGQFRKDGRTPYASHPFRVCLVVQLVFGVSDPRVLTAALLHDTVEDTTTDFDDVAERFGPEVAAWVAALSKDKRLPDDEREAAYCRQLAAAPWPVTVCKLADIYDNLSDSRSQPPAKRARTAARTRVYLDALRTNLSAEARAAFALVQQRLDEVRAEPPG